MDERHFLLDVFEGALNRVKRSYATKDKPDAQDIWRAVAVVGNEQLNQVRQQFAHVMERNEQAIVNMVAEALDTGKPARERFKLASMNPREAFERHFLLDIFEGALNQVRDRRISFKDKSAIQDIRSDVDTTANELLSNVRQDLERAFNRNALVIMDMVYEALMTGEPVTERRFRLAAQNPATAYEQALDEKKAGEEGVLTWYQRDKGMNPDQHLAVAPEGWEPTVKKMKKHPEIDNPWALSWWMRNKGYTPGGKEAMSNPVKDFEYAILVNRVATRYADELVAMEFPTEDALDKYLKEHPKADKANHTVNPNKKPSRKEKLEVSDREHQKSEAYKTEKAKDYYPQKAPEGMKLPDMGVSAHLTELAKNMPDEDLDKNKAYNHPAVKKLVKQLLADHKAGKIDYEKDIMGAYKELQAAKSKTFDKYMDAKTDAEADPYRFATRKLYQVWRAYNDAFQQIERGGK